MDNLLRWFFFGVLVRGFVGIFLGLNVRHRERLPIEGPAILVANHNSHLDTLVLISLFPIRLLPRVRPAAAMDYFLRNRLLAWFALNVIGIIPVARKPQPRTASTRFKTEEFEAGNPPSRKQPYHILNNCERALQRGEILIFFPEGTRGEPEKRAKFKTGIAHLAETHTDVPVIPIFIHGLGKALPKGEGLLVPFFCDVFVGEAVHWGGERAGFMAQLEQAMEGLEQEGGFREWD